MNVLVTGGAGFIGSHLVTALAARGDRVVVLDNFDTFYDPKLKRETAARLKAELVEGDLSVEADVARAFAAVGPNPTVVHLAARAGVRPSIAQPALYAKVNVEGTSHMLEAARKAQARRFVFASSSSVYGARSNPPFSEDDRIDRPVSPYAATKIAGEMLCATFAHLYQLTTIGLRFFTVYGPRQRPDLAISKFAKLIRRGEPVPFFGDGTTARDYTFVEDTVRGITAAIDRPLPLYEVVNLGGSRPVTLNELVAAIEKAAGKKAVLEKKPDQPGDVPLTCASTVKSKQLLGFEARVPVDEGLQRYFAWLDSDEAKSWR
ncbi:MAG: SDR family NAD(P)-dependent oxidoreductase [Archangiaceae bacterium]|nr:SDR family NAD(P)-dependent oxidoreductase [Archangiaceae bacterium]